MVGKRNKRLRPDGKHIQNLTDQLEDPAQNGVRTEARPASKRRRWMANQVAEDDDQGLDAATSSRIMEAAKLQQEEMEAEEAAAHSLPGLPQSVAKGRGSSIMQQLADESDDEDGTDGFSDVGSLGGWDEAEEEEISPEDQQALAAFMAPEGQLGQQRTLADLILDKIKASKGDGGSSTVPTEELRPAGLDPKAIEVYQGVGRILHRYSAGKLPKAFKIIPNLRNWEDVLFVTEPEQWSPHSVYQATRLFISNLNAKMAQRFLALVLLPHVRQNVQDNKRLHFALFQAMKKAAFKPDAFYKGLLLPLCQSGTCTLREAVIFTAMLKRTSIPALHSAAALLRIAEMPYSGTNSFFIRVLLDKKYALPYRVVDALVDHFMRFQTEERMLPVVWHQSLLCFVQRYKHEIRAEDRAALRKLMKAQHHYQVSPEILRELDAAKPKRDKGTSIQAMELVPAVVPKAGAENLRDLPPVPMDDEF
ncbi:hypothetical protein WJX84_011381 [Apatococcus fuscideae]|uniref:Bystin n=1 Tax=Apatococcus fuscideae TaxID=2026836 RepID=A0AAW1T3N0_9CHLO